MSEKVRTLLHVFSTFNVGGAQVRFVRIANHFGRKYRHFIVSMDGGAEAFAHLSHDLDVTMMTIPCRRAAFLANVARFRKEIRKLAPDVLITSNWGSIEWAVARIGGPTRHLHMEDGFGRDEVKSQIARRVWLRRFALRRSTVVLPSMALLAIAKDVWRLPPAHLLHIPNGINCKRFQAASDPDFLANFGIVKDGPVIGTVAGLRPEKNLYRLIGAFARVLQSRRAQLVIVGDGPERGALRAHALALGVADRVVFTGVHPEPEKFLSCFTVFALSSDTEQMPLSVLEAMAAGLPIVATDVGDVRYMVAEDNARFLVEPNTGALSEAMLMVINDQPLARALGFANAERASRLFSDQAMFAAYGQLFDGATINHDGFNHV